MSVERGTNFLLEALTSAMRRVSCSTVEDMRTRLPAEFEAVLREQYGGETLRVYIRQTTAVSDRAKRDQRIEAALAAGEAPESIAKREDLSKRHARRIRARFV